jgi:tetratricopeptide (TPR) repeat protein
MQPFSQRNGIRGKIQANFDKAYKRQCSGKFSLAKTGFERVVKLTRSKQANSESPDIVRLRIIALFNIANCHWQIADIDGALRSFRSAVKEIDAASKRVQQEVQYFRVAANGQIAKCLSLLQDNEGARTAYVKTRHLLPSKYQIPRSDQKQMADAIIPFLFEYAGFLLKCGRYRAVIRICNHTAKCIEDSAMFGDISYYHDLGMLYSLQGSAAQAQGENGQALQSYRRAKAHYIKIISAPQEIAWSKQSGGSNPIVGNTLVSYCFLIIRFASLSDVVGRLSDLKHAMEILESGGFSGMLGLNGLRTIGYLEKAKAHVDDADYFSAVDSADKSLSELSGSENTLTRRDETLESEAIRFGSTLLLYRKDGHDWSRAHGSRIEELQELALPELLRPQTTMNRKFGRFHEVFHSNWLRFSLSKQGYAPEVVPEILSAIQGRTLVAEVLEAALAGDADAPEPVRMLAEHKQRMREVLEQIREEGEMGLSAGMLGVGSPEGMRGGGFERPWVPKPSEKSQEALRAELQRFRDDLPKLKEAAAKVEGYEILDAPHTQITTERLQGVLGKGEALALAFTHGGEGAEPLAGEENPDLSEKGYVFVLRNSGEPQLVPCAALPGLASRFERFTESLPAGRMRRGAWHASAQVRGPEGLPSGSAAEVPKAERLSREEMESFWDDQSEAMRETLWDPLVESGVLKGADRILLATAGDLHNLPFEPGRETAGAPEMVHVNSLAMFALGRGLYKQTGNGKAARRRASATDATAPKRTRAAMLCHPGDRPNDPGYLKFAEAERDAAQALWTEALGADAVTSASGYPWGETGDEVDLLHVACHGDVLKEQDRTPRPVMRLAPASEDDSGLIGEREYLRGPKAREVLMNICVGGQVFDDSFDGNPTGLVAGALRHGAHTVVASLPPVPDEHGYVFGVLVTLLMTRRGLSLAAATGVAKRVMARAPRAEDKAEDLIRMLHETRAKLLFPLMAKPPAYRQKQLAKLLEAIHENGELPGLAWLSEDLAARILADPPASLEELTTLIAETTPLISDRARSPAADGIITYGITTFGDPKTDRSWAGHTNLPSTTTQQPAGNSGHRLDLDHGT